MFPGCSDSSLPISGHEWLARLLMLRWSCCRQLSLEAIAACPQNAPDSDGGWPQHGQQHEANNLCMALEGPEWPKRTLCSLALLLMQLAAVPFEEQCQVPILPQICIWSWRTLGKRVVRLGGVSANECRPAYQQ